MHLVNGRDLQYLLISLLIAVRNKFDTLQVTFESHSTNDEYENFVSAYIEAKGEDIPTKTRAKCRVP